MLPAPPTLLATLGAGFGLGLLHALDADHLVAVSTLVSERPSPRRSAAVALAWGAGHALALGIAGVVVLVAGRAVPPALGVGFELGVAAMLVVLGLQAARRGLAPVALHVHVHAHDGRVHAHRHLHVGGVVRHEGLLHRVAHGGRRPFAVGLVHGLAGSAALSLLLLAALPGPAAALGYLAVFGAGSIAGMVIASVVVTLPLAVVGCGPAWLRRLQVVVGGGGAAFGCLLAVRTLLGAG